MEIQPFSVFPKKWNYALVPDLLTGKQHSIKVTSNFNFEFAYKTLKEQDECKKDSILAMLHDEKRGLVVFDVEGVLIPKNRYLFFEIGRKLSFSQFARIVFYAFLYGLGLTSLNFALKKIFKVFKGLKVQELLQIFKGIPLMPDAEKVFTELRKHNWKTALISSGLPDFVVKDLAHRLKADYGFGLSLETKDDVATGEISGKVIQKQGKLLVLKSVLESMELTPEKCVVVADDRNNAPMMLPQMLKIGYNPDFVIRVKADYVVTGGLAEILHIINGENLRKTVLPSKNEIFRETIHACGFTIPLLSNLIGKYATAFLIVAVTILYIFSEFAIMEGKYIPIVSSIKRSAATHGELHEFAAAPIFFAFGILLTLLIFPVPTSSAAIAIFAFGDSSASIFGKICGKRALPFNKGKTLEGLVIGTFFSFLAGIFFINPFEAFVAAAVAMLVECLPLPISDNLVIPLTAAVTLALIS